MKRFTMLAASTIFAALFAVSAFGQTGVPAAAGKIGLINTSLFGEEKGGITKFKNALGVLETEFKPVNDELRTMGTKYTVLGEEIKKFRESANNPAIPMKPETIQAKIDEFQTLETQIKRKEEDAKARYQQRYSRVVGPVFNDIVKALNDYAKQKGYAVILDGARLEQADLLLGFDDKYDVTRDFITFYNARPAGTASAAAPK